MDAVEAEMVLTAISQFLEAVNARRRTHLISFAQKVVRDVTNVRFTIVAVAFRTFTVMRNALPTHGVRSAIVARRIGEPIQLVLAIGAKVRLRSHCVHRFLVRCWRGRCQWKIPRSFAPRRLLVQLARAWVNIEIVIASANSVNHFVLVAWIIYSAVVRVGNKRFDVVIAFAQGRFQGIMEIDKFHFSFYDKVFFSAVDYCSANEEQLQRQYKGICNYNYWQCDSIKIIKLIWTYYARPLCAAVNCRAEKNRWMYESLAELPEGRNIASDWSWVIERKPLYTFRRPWKWCV